MDKRAVLEAIRSESLGGWLFHNYRHRDPLSDAILGRPAGAVNTRRWFYALGADGQAVKIVHSIERGALDGLEGRELVYGSLDGLKAALASLPRGPWACHFSPHLPAVSTIDAGTYLLLVECGLELADASPLIQRLQGLLSRAGIESHERAARCLRMIVDDIWAGLRRQASSGSLPCEGKLRDDILSAFQRMGLVTDHPPIVAAGLSSADPHYEVLGPGRPLMRGQVLQLDLWAKEGGPEAIYADISWIGFLGEEPEARHEKAARDVFALRDAALAYIRDGLRRGQAQRGCDVDALVRNRAAEMGLEGSLRHRTGHGIDRECHGSGVNLDSVEFPDQRRILEGSCFSIEPGLYFEDFGLRTEIDVYIQEGAALVSGGEAQGALLLLGDL